MATGAQRSVNYGFELTAAGADNFGAGANLVNKAFGFATECEPELDRSVQARYGSGSRNYQTTKAGRVMGSVSPSFDLADPWILESILGAHGAISGSTGSYATTFSESDNPTTLEIDICQNLTSATYLLRKLYGVVIKKASLSFESSSDMPIRLTMDCDYANEVKSNPVSLTAQIAPQQAAPITFANCSVATSSNGTDYTTIANLDRCELTIDNSAVLRHAAGSPIAARKKFGQRKYSIALTNLLDADTDFLDKVYGSTTGPSAEPSAIPYLKVTFSAEVGGSIAFIFTNAVVAKHKATGNNADDELFEVVDILPKTCSIAVAGWDNTEPTRY